MSMVCTCARIERDRIFSRMLKKDVQQGRRRVEPKAYHRGYVEDFAQPRTKLADFFSILL